MEFILRIFHALTELHPLYPMFVHFPIALTGAGSLFILLAMWRRSTALEQGAFFNMVLAFLGTVAAGSSGIRDNFVNYDGAAPNALPKVVLASVLLLITGFTAFFRGRNSKLLDSPRARPFYVAAYPVSFAITFVLASLGAVILYGF